MSKATELIERAKKRFEELGYKVNNNSLDGRFCNINSEYSLGMEHTKGWKSIYMYTTYRNNGEIEDVTVTIEILETLNKYGCSKVIEKFKIPKNASENVLNKRVQRAIEAIK